MLSAAVYDAVRHVLVLPSDRTLRDYTHFIKSGIGIQNEVTMQLMKEANIDASEEWQKFVALSFDEIKIKEGIVYDKHECRIIGFVDLGPTNNLLAVFDNATTVQSSTIPVANHMLTIMVRGILTNLCFPYTHYSTNGVTAVELYSIIWESIRTLECAGFKVISITGDGCSANRKFFRMHRLAAGNTDSTKPTHKIKNPYSKEERFIYFFVDVPHLLKTVRNCWSNSFGHSHSRALWVGHFFQMCLLNFTL